LQLSLDPWNILKEFQSFFHCHIQDIGNILALVPYIQGLPVIPLALADLTGHIYIGQEMHLNFENTVPRTRLTPAAFDIKAETPGGIPLHFGIHRIGK